MVKKVFSIFDSAVGTYSPPFLCRAHAEAIRAFQQEAQNEQSAIFRSPKDYTLFELGEFDDETAQFMMLNTPHRLVGAHEFVTERVSLRKD